MVISEKHRYLFIEIPHTGTHAIRRELCELYDGHPILRTHSSYREFLSIANEDQKKYFVFAGIRNPLDEVVSVFFKVKSDHEGKYSDTKYWVKEKDGNVTKRDERKFAFVHQTNAEFSQYFMEFYHMPFNSKIFLSQAHCDFVMRFENIQEDFAAALERIGLDSKRPLPVINKTQKEAEDFHDYYTPDAIVRAKRVFGQFMKTWQYEFPAQWGETNLSRLNKVAFYFSSFIRFIYWRITELRLRRRAKNK